MGSLTNQILNSIQKLGCDCSAVCKSCTSFSIPAAQNPCKGCKYGSLGGEKDNYVKESSAKSSLVKKTLGKKGTQEVAEESKDSEMSTGGSGNVGNTPPAVTEKRAWDRDAFLSALISGLTSGRK
jgi:hypothetical protein